MSLREGYKQTEIGVIPEEWDISALKDFANLNMGQSPDSSYVNEEVQGMPFAQGNSDFRKKYFVHTKKFCTEPKKKAKSGDILFSVRAPVGDINIATFDLCIGRGLAAINAKNNQQEYLYQLLMSLSQKLNSSAQGSTFTAINKSDLENIKIPIPPLPEQQKIAEILSTVDQKMDSIDSKIEETQTLKRGLMQRLLSEGIGHSEFKESEIGRIPAGWEVLQLEQISKITDSLHITPEFTEEGFAMVRVADIKTGMLNLSGTLKVSEETYTMFTKSYRPKKGNIVLSRVGSYGVSSFVSTDEPFCMGQNTVVIEPKIDNRFLYLFLNSTNIKKQIEDGSYGSGYKSLSLKHIKQLKVAVPSKEEQKQIAEILSITDEKLESLRAKKEAFETLKKGLMQKLLSGEVRVKE